MGGSRRRRRASRPSPQRSASRLEQRLETHGHAMASTTVDFSQRVVAALDSLDDALEEFQQALVRQAAERTELDPAAGVAHDVLTKVAGNEPAAAHMPTGPLTWSKDAQAELDRAPFFVKGPAKDGAEKYARQVGASEVTLDIVNASRGNKSDFEVAREIIGGGNGRKASNAEIASVIVGARRLRLEPRDPRRGSACARLSQCCSADAGMNAFVVAIHGHE